MEAEPIEPPPELIQRYEQACEDWCSVLAECDRDDITCHCADRDLSEEHELCVEKAALRLECEASLTCEEIDLRTADSARDRPCFGQIIAETGACR